MFERKAGRLGLLLGILAVLPGCSIGSGKQAAAEEAKKTVMTYAGALLRQDIAAMIKFMDPEEMTRAQKENPDLTMDEMMSNLHAGLGAEFRRRTYVDWKISLVRPISADTAEIVVDYQVDIQLAKSMQRESSRVTYTMIKRDNRWYMTWSYHVIEAILASLAAESESE